MPPPSSTETARSMITPSTSEPGGKIRISKAGSRGGGIWRVFKLLPMLSTGCKMVAHLGRPSKALLARSGMATVTLFGCRRGRVSLAIQEDPSCPPAFLIELPLLTSALHKEMASGLVRIALESEARTHRRKLTDECVWAVYCNGRRSGYAVRRKQASDEDRYVMRLLRGVSMAAGVLPSPAAASSEGGERETQDGDMTMTYMRARFERVVGSRDSEALYMINPDGTTGGPDLSIFLVRVK